MTTDPIFSVRFPLGCEVVVRVLILEEVSKSVELRRRRPACTWGRHDSAILAIIYLYLTWSACQPCMYFDSLTCFSILHHSLLSAATAHNTKDNAPHCRTDHLITLLQQSSQRARTRSSRYAKSQKSSLKRTDTTRELVDTKVSFPTIGHKIPTIENLGSAKDQEAIDFTDNAIQTLSGFPLSPRLQTLLLAQNRINTISESTAKVLPNLHTLVLSQNALAELSDLDALEGFQKLTYLSCVGCPVASKDVSEARGIPRRLWKHKGMSILISPCG